MGAVVSRILRTLTIRLGKGMLLVATSALFGAQAARAVSVSRGPYLQNGTPTAVTVMWRTSSSTNSRVRYGSSPTSPAYLGFCSRSFWYRDAAASGV